MNNGTVRAVLVVKVSGKASPPAPYPLGSHLDLYSEIKRQYLYQERRHKVYAQMPM